MSEANLAERMRKPPSALRAQIEALLPHAPALCGWSMQDPAPERGFFNQWRDEKYGTTMYHLNNAAMEVQLQPDGSVILRCSDGWGEPDFNDLVVTVHHRPAWTLPVR